MKKLGWLLLVIILVFACSTMPQQPTEMREGDYSYLKEYITWYIEKEMKKNKVVGVSLAVVDEGEVVWTQGFGYADKEQGRKADGTTLYELGSISKLFTATSIMQLAEQGKLDIDAPLTQYIPEFKIKSRFPDSPPITLRMIMTHHSGLPSDKLAGMFIKDPSVSETFTEYLKYIAQIHVAYPPQYILSYSNMGMTILGEVVSRVSGLPYTEYVKQNIFAPLNMNNASMLSMYMREEVQQIVSQPYTKIKNYIPIKYYIARDMAAGSLNAGVLEMSNFLRMILAGGQFNGSRILLESSLEQMMVPQNADNLLDAGALIGLNWFLSDSQLDYAGKFCGHDGGTVYFTSSLKILPEHKMGVIVACNTSAPGFNVTNIATEVLQLLLEQKSGLLPPPAAVKTKVELTPQIISATTGTFASYLAGGVVQIYEKRNKLMTKFNGVNIHLVPYENGWFGMEAKLLGFIKIPIGILKDMWVKIETINNKRILMIDVSGARMAIGEEYTPLVIPAVWKKRLGKYEIINADPQEESISLMDLVLKEQDNIPSLGNLPLQPISDNQALVLGIGRGSQETVYVRNIDGEELLEIKGYLCRKIES